MKLFLIHCGYYDTEIGDGLFESHVNYFVVASDWQAARLEIKARDAFKAKRMHIDGIQEIESINGWKIELHRDETARPAIKGSFQDSVRIYRHRDLAATAHQS